MGALTQESGFIVLRDIGYMCQGRRGSSLSRIRNARSEAPCSTGWWLVLQTIFTYRDHPHTVGTGVRERIHRKRNQLRKKTFPAAIAVFLSEIFYRNHYYL